MRVGWIAAPRERAWRPWITRMTGGSRDDGDGPGRECRAEIRRGEHARIAAEALLGSALFARSPRRIEGLASPPRREDNRPATPREKAPMTVLLNNGNNADHSVGLVAVSSWQGWLRHLPRQSDVQQPGYGVSNITRFLSTFTFSAPKAAFGYFKNGHTALVARQALPGYQLGIEHVSGISSPLLTFRPVLQTARG